MPTKRTPLGRPMRSRVTPAAVDLFRCCMEIEDADQQVEWEEDGGRKREWRDARVALHQLLGRHPAETNVMDAAAPTPPAYRCHDYEGAHELYVELASRCDEKRGRPPRGLMGYPRRI